MKKSFVYALSALFALSVMMTQIPAQAAITHHSKKIHHEKRMLHHKKGVTGGAASITKKNVTGTKKEMPMKKEHKKYEHKKY